MKGKRDNSTAKIGDWQCNIFKMDRSTRQNNKKIESQTNTINQLNRTDRHIQKLQATKAGYILLKGTWNAFQEKPHARP